MILFIKEVIISTGNFIKKKIINLISNLESVLILCAATIGLSSILAEIPFHFTLPVIVDIPMVIPFISCLIITGLIYSIKLRNNNDIRCCNN